MKLVIFGLYSDIKSYYGSNIYNYKLIEYLSQINGLELHVITIGDRNDKIIANNLHIHLIKKSKYLSIPHFHPILISKLIWSARMIKPDVIHVISAYYPYSTAAAILRKKFPIVLTAYGILANEIPYYSKDIKNIYKKIYYDFFSFFDIMNERYVLSRIPNIIVDSQSIKNLIKNWTKSNIYAIPAGLDYNELQGNFLYNPSLERPDIFLVNNFYSLKGIDILIKATSLVKKHIPEIKVFIGGSGVLEKDLKYLAQKLDLDENIKFLGFISDKDKFAYYNLCKIVVVPSRWDCQPAALFEAGAFGKPVIASDMSNPGIIEDYKTGLIFKSEDIADLAQKILILMNDKELRVAMGSAAKEKVKIYDWDNVVQEYLSIYLKSIECYNEEKRNRKR
jgi:glycosyltransferase involved in cell wall biosynthesis